MLNTPATATFMLMSSFWQMQITFNLFLGSQHFYCIGKKATVLHGDHSDTNYQAKQP
jgi:hypothetical protein